MGLRDEPPIRPGWSSKIPDDAYNRTFSDPEKK